MELTLDERVDLVVTQLSKYYDMPLRNVVKHILVTDSLNVTKARVGMELDSSIPEPE